MARRMHPQPHLSVDELERRYRAGKEPHERSWWQILWLLAEGRTATELAGVTGYSANWIGQLAQRYNVQGPDGRRNHHHTTSRRTPPLLSPALQEELLQALAGPASDEDPWGGRPGAGGMPARPPWP